LFDEGAEHEAADAAETVDAHFHCHCGYSFVRIAISPQPDRRPRLE
jgi:hypothetical protein